METTATTPTTASASDEVQRNLPRNFTAYLLYDGSFSFGMSLISSSVILPLFVSNLSDSPLLVGLIMTITFSGGLVPQLFTAPLVARFSRVKRLLVPGVLLAEMLPLLLLGPAMMALVPAGPTAALVAFFLLLAWNAFGLGFNAVAIKELYARIIPVANRGRLFGIAGAAGIGLALIGTAVNRGVLGRWAFPTGYVVLFSLAGLSGLLAWFWLTRVREPDTAIPPNPESFAAFFKKIPGVVARDANYTRFLVAMAVLYLGGMSGAFLAVAAKGRWGLPESYIVTFPVAMYIGQALGNLLCGWIADRRGYKILQIIANAANVGLLLIAILARAPWLFYAVFALKGLSIAADVMGNLITLEFSEPALRPAYIGIYHTVSGVVFIFSPLLAGMLAEWFGYDGLFWLTAGITTVGLGLLHFTVRDPRVTR